MYLQAEAVKQSVFFKHIETMAEKAKQIARVIALLYGVSDAYDSQIQAIFECCPPVIYILKRAFEGCVNTVESPDENEEVANGLSDLDLMSIDPLLTEIANRLFVCPSSVTVLVGRIQNIFRFFKSELMLKENLAENRKELDAVARGLQMAENTRYMLSSLRPESPNTSDESVFDVTYLRNMKIEEINFQFSSAVYCGEGSFGQVLKVKSTDGNEYAVKIFKQGRRLKKRFLEEVKVWSQLDDDFILRLRGFCVVDFSPLPGLVAELCQGSLKDLVVSNQRNTGGDGLSAMQRLEFLRDINYGLRYLHLRSIAHGDLRAANVLITFPTEDNGGQPKAILCDFGISKSEMEVVEDIAAHVIAGKRLSEAWRSPEIVSWYREKNQIRVSSEGDMYSYGCVFLEVAYDREPFKDVNSPGDMLLKGKLPAECDDITGLKTAHWSFMKSLWAFDPSKRLDVNAANVEINELIEWNDSS
ncbi:hypothetical protein M0805_005518 [Coniferiporia weirii]|nr:hypothetical protein M0805_005518 [Coniferiporia weirii]